VLPKPKSIYGIATVIWLIAVVGKFKYHGLIFGFDYGIYQPDGTYYAYMTLKDLGFSAAEAANKVSDWYSTHAFKMKTIDPNLLMDPSTLGSKLVATRILYPHLSAPFVFFLGIPGMLVIPALSLLVLLLSIAYFGIKFKQQVLSLVLILLFTASPTVMRWMIVNTTDSLLAALFSIVAVALYQKRYNPTFINVLFFSALIIFSSFTRFCLPIWISLAIFFLLKKQVFFSFYLLCFSVLASVPALLTSSRQALLPGDSDSTFIGKLFSFPISLAKVGFIEVAELVILDKLLLMLLCFSIYVAIKNLAEDFSVLFLLVLISVFVIGGINGTLGVNFRYQMPVLPFMALVIFSARKKDLEC
jgi:hypothetical protein